MYGKIFEQIYEGSLRMNWKALITFQQMIILCDKDGVLDMSHEALHFRTGIPLNIIKDGIEILESADDQSRTRTYEGRRITRISKHRVWGWRLVNHAYYRDLLNHEDKKARDRKRMVKIRAAEKANKISSVANSRKKSPLSQNVRDVAHTNTDTNTNTDTYTTPRGEKRKTLLPDDFSLTDKLTAYAIDRKIDPARLHDFLQSFIDYHTNNSSRMVDWNRAWYTFVR
ncbi:MAG: hypothetical protein GY850_32615, partial [bacterium]|nr:hypothetical protein [bacterium]